MNRVQYLLIVTLGFFSCVILGQSKPIGQIPFSINEKGLIVIALKINKQNVTKFVLDTGASVTIIDDDIVQELNLPLEYYQSESSGSGGVNNDRARTNKQYITITDKVNLKDITISVTDLSVLGDINGLIGFDLLRNYVTDINFDTQVITFYKKKGKPDTKGYTSINFVESFCTPEVNITVRLKNNETYKGKVFFDTGNTASPLIISTPYKTKHNLSSKFESLITTESNGIHATIQSTQGAIQSLKLGEFELEDMPIILSNSEQGFLSWGNYMGLLGLEYISKFNVIIDYHRGKIYLKPNSSFSNSFDFPLSGISLKEENNSIVIKSISQPSNAYNQGLRKGQQVISINGIENGNISSYDDLLKSEGQEVTIIVKLENGELKTAKIRLKRLL